MMRKTRTTMLDRSTNVSVSMDDVRRLAGQVARAPQDPTWPPERYAWTGQELRWEHEADHRNAKSTDGYTMTPIRS